MSDRWQILSLEEFFSYANWQGVVRQKVSSSSEIESQLFSNWQILSLEEFFSHANWQGKALTNETNQTTKVDFSLTLPVEQLFGYFDWEGKPKIAAFSPLKIEKNVAQASTPTMNIADLTELF
ncbi:hypothetical protein Sta7437_3622 [Stanieria cyanosphaera PCC 7437]|uniref:Uncharacterized protein n=1 Tax=Stanieria cyanosphaera (strain ATCC 29371 / PCC 7437) TaxID=111780 RepID=K9XWZ3_STAC7|nr:hypothetical protein [Stanieria cyanosphaera]AFZ37120.1 hypothetical protein Sta7437_3622 [Stanieria cyanosphaera PCC 7437]